MEINVQVDWPDARVLTDEEHIVLALAIRDLLYGMDCIEATVSFIEE
jgi:hypothetical protein